MFARFVPVVMFYYTHAFESGTMRTSRASWASMGDGNIVDIVGIAGGRDRTTNGIACHERHCASRADAIVP